MQKCISILPIIILSLFFYNCSDDELITVPIDPGKEMIDTTTTIIDTMMIDSVDMSIDTTIIESDSLIRKILNLSFYPSQLKENNTYELDVNLDGITDANINSCTAQWHLGSQTIYLIEPIAGITISTETYLDTLYACSASTQIATLIYNGTDTIACDSVFETSIHEIQEINSPFPHHSFEERFENLEYSHIESEIIFNDLISGLLNINRSRFRDIGDRYIIFKLENEGEFQFGYIKINVDIYNILHIIEQGIEK